jgi:V/A-type H+-transporting ATPase subunit D
VDAAVAVAAARVLDDEVAATRFRLRAVQDRWLPRLQGAATTLDLALAEAEGAEAVRLRLAVSRGEGAAGSATDPERSAPQDGWSR